MAKLYHVYQIKSLIEIKYYFKMLKRYHHVITFSATIILLIQFSYSTTCSVEHVVGEGCTNLEIVCEMSGLIIRSHIERRKVNVIIVQCPRTQK